MSSRIATCGQPVSSAKARRVSLNGLMAFPSNSPGIPVGATMSRMLTHISTEV